MHKKQATLVGAVTLFLAAAWILVPLRCYARLKVVRRLGFDDWMMVVALVRWTPGLITQRSLTDRIPQALFTVDCAFGLKLTQLGMGLHVEQPVELAYIVCARVKSQIP